MKTIAPQSPLSALPPKKVRDLSRQFILDQLAIYYKSEPPPEAVEGDYSIWKCAETGLEFAWPMLPGNAVFYQWISSFASYYPATRWEYGKTNELIRLPHSADSQVVNVLDAGCGKGDFLLGVNIPPKNKFALDMNKPAIEECRRRGFNAFCGTIEAAKTAGAFAGTRFDAVTSFHCLEACRKSRGICPFVGGHRPSRRTDFFEHTIFSNVIRSPLVRHYEPSSAPPDTVEPGSLRTAGRHARLFDALFHSSVFHAKECPLHFPVFAVWLPSRERKPSEITAGCLVSFPKICRLLLEPA